MKKFKSFIAWFATALGLAGTMTACQDVDAPSPAAPVAEHEANTTIYDLKKAFWLDDANYIYGMENVEDATPVAVPTREDGSHYYIHGTVISTDEAGNVFKSLVIQDETAAIAISINSYNLYLNYRRGQDVVIDVTGMYIGKYNGLLQLGHPQWYSNGNVWEASFMAPETFSRHVELNGYPTVAAIDTIEVNSFSELPSNPDGLMRYQSQIVKFNNVEFANGGKETFSTYHSSGVNQSIIDADGNSLPVRTSGYSNFWNKTLPSGRGDVVCILSYYGTTGWQLILNDYEGCMNFGNPSLPVGSESKPWTVEEAIAVEEGTSVRSGWVYGYIVGAVAPEVTSVTSNDDIEWSATPILDNTLVIGQTPDTKDLAHAMVIELPAGSKLYEYGNLVSNPGNYGKRIDIRGTLEKVMDTYGITGNTGATGTWKIEGVETGGSAVPAGDGTQASPYNVQQVLAGASGTAWVKGYIVGWVDGMTLSEGANFNANATAASNVLIAATPDETDYTKCVPVQLPVGDVRTAVNLMNNPGNLGRAVSLNGSLEKYFGTAGLKTVTAYEFDGDAPVTPPTPSQGDGSKENPYKVSDVQGGASGTAWVEGVIVGWVEGMTLADGAHFDANATSQTNILLAATAGVTDYTKCVPVQLPAGTLRTALNLQSNPGNLGKTLKIYGSLEKYFGVAGVKTPSEYVLDGAGTPDVPTTPTIVTSLDETFSGAAIPATWTNKQVAGDKAWYTPSFNDNYYAAMTGYKGTAPFDSWLITPGIDIAKCADKKLTFDTQVNGYGSTTTVFEVYVLTGNDPSTATKTKLNPAIATAPASGYSDWVASGALDLSSYSGTIYIGFRYYATTDANYATWCVDNVKLNAGGTGGGDEPVTPPTPPTPSGDMKGDFNSFNDGVAKASPYGTYTNATGWTAENSIILGGDDDPTKASNPYFGFIGASGTIAPTLNGKVGAAGKLTSPLLTGGCGTLTFKYGFAFAESKCAFTINIKDASGNVVKSDTVTLDSITKNVALDYSLDVNVSGDFYIEIVNNSYSGATGNKDRVSIWNLTWTSK